MRTGIDPTIDIVFKKIFGSPGREHLTLHFLNEILPLAGRDRAASLSILNPFVLAEFEGSKEIHVDLRLEDERHREYQVEMQVRPRGAFDERMLDNWAHLYAGQLARGDAYEAHRQVISLWVIRQEHFRDGRWLHVFEARDLVSNRVLSPSFLIITLELDAWSRLRKEDGRAIVEGEGLEKWLTLLTEGGSLDPGDLPGSLADADLREALEAMAEFTVKEKERYLYQRRLDFERSRLSEMNEARAEGKAEGERRKALDTARRLKGMGMEIAKIAEATGLSMEEVEGT